MPEWVEIALPDASEDPDPDACAYLTCDVSGDQMRLTIDATFYATPIELARWLRLMADAVEARVPWVDPDVV